ncbi:MAG TPA: glycosyltransferase family 4 protein [Thermoleophilaceae bacterium]
MPLVRVLVFHGYLLRGTGSNIYNASLAAALVKLGHEVHILCQDRHASELDFVDAVGTFENGSLSLETLREPVRCTAYLPEIGRILPVYVADEYEGFEAKPFGELTGAELDHYLDANVAAVRTVAEAVKPEVALANHAVMGPAILAQALGDEVPYAVKIHGSALEYTVRPDPERFLPYAREGIEPAKGVLVGSRHMAERLWELVDVESLREKTRLGPPGVDTDAFTPLPRREAAARVKELSAKLRRGGARWGGDANGWAALRALDPEHEPVVAYVGKLIVSKGVDLLIAAWPLVVERVPNARLCVVGFGTYRGALTRLIDALANGDLAAAREIAARGRELEGGPTGELKLLASFLDSLEGERRERYLGLAAYGAERIHFTGRLEHEDLPLLLPACEAQVVPSTFPEAFGMVVVEGAACGLLPIAADHSGLAEVTDELELVLPDELRSLMSFRLEQGSVEAIAERLLTWLELDPKERRHAGCALADRAAERYGWDHVASGVVAAAQGRLDALPSTEPAGSPSLRPSG